jgi:hypothetical protein
MSVSMGFSEPAEQEPKKVYGVAVECQTTQPALLPALFDIIRTQARMSGFDDVGKIYVEIEVEFMGGSTNEHHLGELQGRLEALWLGAHVYATQRRGHSTDEGDAE